MSCLGCQQRREIGRRVFKGQTSMSDGIKEMGETIRQDVYKMGLPLRMMKGKGQMQLPPGPVRVKPNSASVTPPLQPDPMGPPPGKVRVRQP